MVGISGSQLLMPTYPLCYLPLQLLWRGKGQACRKPRAKKDTRGMAPCNHCWHSQNSLEERENFLASHQICKKLAGTEW